MKKIVILNSSLRKKTTYNLLKKIETHFDDYNIDFINIKDYEIKPCIGCENCLRRGQCNIKDQTQIVLDKLSQADGIIIGTPVYLRQISGHLKVLIDRGCAWYHRSPLVGKPILFVTTTQVTGSKQAIEYLKDLSLQWGTIDTGYISRRMFNADKDLTDKSLKLFEYYLKDKNKLKYRPTMKQILEFNTQKVLAVNILPLDLEYWTEKEYINKPYYYKCKINIFTRLIGIMHYKILSYFIAKNKTE